MRRMSWGRTRIIVALTVLVVAAVSPAVARGVEARVARIVEQGVSGSVTFKITSQGHDVGQKTTGVVGQGTISGKLSLGAKLGATLLGAVKGVPITTVAKGGSYVVRYDVDAHGNHNGTAVITFKSSSLGSLCIDFTATYGRFQPGKTDYVPASGTFSTAGGTGAIARVHAFGRYDQGEVAGDAIERILANGSVTSLTSGSPTAPSKSCQAVAKLAKR